MQILILLCTSYLENATRPSSRSPDEENERGALTTDPGLDIESGGEMEMLRKCLFGDVHFHLISTGEAAAVAASGGGFHLNTFPTRLHRARVFKKKWTGMR